MKKRTHVLSIILCLGVLPIAYGTGQAGFYVIPVVRDSAPATTCANDGYEVLSDTGRCWMAFNLGATQVATAIDDEAAYGDLYQWGRPADGHQRRDNPTTTTTDLSTTDAPGYRDFITVTSGPYYDWRSPRNDFLWQGLSGINNPCPQGFRLPTDAEWQAELGEYGTSAAALFNSPLKLVAAGSRGNAAGILYNAGSDGNYWSSTINGGHAGFLDFVSGGSDAYQGFTVRAYGFSVRCIKD
ncbi:MAG: FISUMP domain-containing protein [Candidatus Electrothrix sp. GW3-4]|uniref:FISUMP domain-containing protein n=1 Tax=Candidatus Electrothrix sp. GW3-4 TaxID=3126740 RepID=UPI0030D45223